MQLLIATRNSGKIPEIQKVLEGLSIEVVGLSDIPSISAHEDVEEPAETFEGNALIKAIMWGTKANILTLADDSGLAVDTLEDWPGVKTARIAPNDDARNDCILEKTKHIPEGERGAALHCVIALYDPLQKKVRVAHGKAQGHILQQPEGTGGFGVDPIFYYDEAGKSGGLLTLEEKNTVSHRGKAMQAARAILEQEFMGA